MIAQRTMARIVALRAKAEKATADLAKVEADLTQRLKAGEAAQSGTLTAYLHKWERRSVAWKEICTREMGEEFVSRVFNATKPQQHETLRVETAA